VNVRIYTNTKTVVNENWNSYGVVNSAMSSDQYRHPIIQVPQTISCKEIVYFQNSFYRYIGIDIVTETVFNYPGVQLTEKTLRPIINKRPFIIVGAPHTLAFLQSKGLKTFSPFINEEYDDIEDPIERIKSLCSEITRIANMPIDKIQDFVLEYTPVLEHNFNVLKDLEKQELAEVADRLSNL
jgi:hypothetical protein